MKAAAITMVHKDYWALRQWYRHYSGALGAENLFVVAHGPDPVVQEICPAASVITIPRDRLQGFDHWRGRLLNGIQRGLLEIYDWVIRTDADELICVDPQLWCSLPKMLAAQEASAIFALGVNVFAPDEASGSPLYQGVFSGHYSKAWAVRQPHDLRRHGVQLRPRRLAEFPYCMPRGVYLAHLKFANRQAATEMADIRTEVAGAEGTGTPGKAWKQAHQEMAAQFAALADLPLSPWEKAEAAAWDALQWPVRDEGISVLRSKSLRFDSRVHLPDWFPPLGD
jgi:hypothetical protein